MRAFIKNNAFINLVFFLPAFNALRKDCDISEGMAFEKYFITYWARRRSRLRLYDSQLGTAS